LVFAAGRNNLSGTMRAPVLARPLAFGLAASVLLFGVTGSGLAPVRAAVAQDPGLAAGIRQVDEGDFEGAVATLGPVADRLSSRRGHDAAQACLYLGIAHLALDQRDAARARFREALGHEPSLRLGPDRFSPKVIAAFEEARRERDAAARAAEPARGTQPESKKGHAGRTVLIVGGAVAVGVGIALAAGGGGSTSSGGNVTFAGARFGTPVLDCPNGTTAMPLAVAIDLSAENGTGGDVTIGSVSAVLIIVTSPGVPGEVGFASTAPATVVPATLRPGTTALRVQTTLTCSNGAGDAARFNEWKGRVTLTTGTAQTVETADTLRVNLP
jgi:hypothetical protein